jgi:hypothetical protein
VFTDNVFMHEAADIPEQRNNNIVYTFEFASAILKE